MKQVIQCGHLFDVNAKQFQANACIYISDNLIEKVEYNAPIKDGYQVLDLSSKYVLPGFIDCHLHLNMNGENNSFETIASDLYGDLTLKAYAYAQKDLMAGFTTLRDEGAYGFSDVSLKNAINSGLVVGPRLLVSGMSISSTGGHGDNHLTPYMTGGSFSTIVNSPSEARKAARYTFKYGADQIKLMATGGVISFGDDPGAPEFTQEELNAICEEANRKGHITSAHDLAFQISNLRGVSDGEYFHGGLPEGVGSSRAPFLYTLNWNGNFLDNALELRWSVSYGTQAERKDLWIIELGQSYRSDWWGVYVDLIYSRQSLDANGILSRASVFQDGMARTLENVEYFSAIGYLHLFFSPSFSAFLKGSMEHGSLYRPYGDIPAGLCRASWNAQACLEYMPAKSRDFRIFLHYNYYSASPTGYGTALGIAGTQEHRLSLGIVYIMNIF